MFESYTTTREYIVDRECVRPLLGARCDVVVPLKHSKNAYDFFSLLYMFQRTTENMAKNETRIGMKNLV